MMTTLKAAITVLALSAAAFSASDPAAPLKDKKFESDIVSTAQGDVEMTFIGHASLIFKFKNTVIHIDPWSAQADYSTLPKADFIFITHQHQDHLDTSAVKHILKESTVCVMNGTSSKMWKPKKPPIVLSNGQSHTAAGVKVDAVPAYNIVHIRPDTKEHYHVKGDGNGYVFTFGDKKIYVGGDTENVPEMKTLGAKGDIEVAFLPMNVPYTMTPEMTADAAKMVKPKILYPYHFGDTDTNKLKELLKNEKSIDVRVRKF
ncbi:MAG: MBL fold metallo-hydrolase [Chitinispirillales bacterium]|jgi:L-ascorbate metabolism protein UlaG (beta-lactamase superfamily)|nr:MBL fold metallo-hydrolase [Chitinispirillales bacterium]